MDDFEKNLYDRAALEAADKDIQDENLKDFLDKKITTEEFLANQALRDREYKKGIDAIIKQK